MPLSYINIDELKTARIVYRQPLRWSWLWRQQIIIASCHIVVWKLFHILISLKSHLSLNTLVFVQFWKCFGHFFFFFFSRMDVKTVIATLEICLLSLAWNWSPASSWKAQFSSWTVRSSHPFRNIGYLLCRLEVTATNLLVHKPAMCFVDGVSLLYLACQMGYSLIMCCQFSTLWWESKMDV